MSNGFQTYINNIQEDTLTSYPLTIDKITADMESMFLNVLSRDIEKKGPDGEKVYVNNIFSDLYQILQEETIENDLVSFKKFLDSNDEMQSLVTDIKYEYNADLNVYKNGVVTYNDSTYGNVRIVATSRNIPCGSIIKYNDTYAIVLDRGVLGYDVDLLVESEDYARQYIGRSKITYEIIRSGW
jgi:hypothetical protein